MACKHIFLVLATKDLKPENAWAYVRFVQNISHFSFFSNLLRTHLRGDLVLVAIWRKIIRLKLDNESAKNTEGLREGLNEKQKVDNFSNLNLLLLDPTKG